MAPSAVPEAASEAAAPAPAMVLRSGQADRIAPPVVPPVERDGIRYAQADDGRSLGWKQVGGVLVATEVATGKPLWSLPVYTREVDPKLEADVQWVFFKSMAFAPSGELLIENESGQRYLVNVQQKTVSPAP